jgi:hypothetical protein
MNPTRVRVDISVRGAWEIELPDRDDRVRCETLEEASRMARRWAAERRPCELIVCDAYHRVVQRELVRAARSAARPASSDRAPVFQPSDHGLENASP